MKVFFDTEFIEDGDAFVMQPISIGMITYDGATLYREFEGVDWSKANDFVKKNVVPNLIGGPWKISKEEIKEEIIKFVGEKPEFWAYFADYDWVILCQLFGKMVDIPKGWPYYCRDLKQLMDHYKITKDTLTEQFGLVQPDTHHGLDDAYWNWRAYRIIEKEFVK